MVRERTFSRAVSIDRALRIENKSFDGEVSPGYFIFGGEPVNEGQNLVFEGGFPMTDGNATGLNLDIRCELPGGSSGFIIVQFKADGIPVGNGNYATGTFHFPITGNMEWTNISLPFEGGINATPDHCVIGIACADLLGNDLPFVAGSFVEIDNLTFENSEVTIPGGDFESWSFVESIMYPDHCSVEIDGVVNQFERSTTASAGQYACGIRTREVDGGVKVGVVTMGSTTNDIITPNIQLASNHSNLSFMYWYQASGEDMALATVRFYAEDQGEFLELFQRDFPIQDNAGYTAFDYDFTEDLAQASMPASHISITFRSSMVDNPQAGSFLLVDDVELSGVLGIFNNNNLLSDNSLLAYPNPTLARVIFDFHVNRSGYYRLYNPGGVQIALRHFNNSRKLIHDLSGLPSGSYLFRFYHEEGIETARVVKQ